MELKITRPSKGPYYKIDPDTGCWKWNRAIGTHGYGVLTYNKVHTLAHRLFYELHHGVTITKKTDIDHLCRNRWCVNPEHMELVSRSINVRRGKVAKLSEEDVLLIKQHIREAELSMKKIGALFGVGGTAIQSIKTGKTWKA